MRGNISLVFVLVNTWFLFVTAAQAAAGRDAQTVSE
jgi:hypothetical protein